MTAGSGILHIEAPPEHLVVTGGLFHGIQLWVNLPSATSGPAALPGHRGPEAALLASPDGGALIRLIAGEVAGHAGPGATHTPITMTHTTLSAGAEVGLPWRPDFNALVYVLAGGARWARSAARPQRSAGPVRSRRRPDPRAAGQDGHAPALDLLCSAAGRSANRSHYGPFVMNTQDELIQAFEDFQAAGSAPSPPSRALATTSWARPSGAAGHRPRQ